jgi:hypothetical protein
MREKRVSIEAKGLTIGYKLSGGKRKLYILTLIFLFIVEKLHAYWG